jgi:hypothetical protein
MKIVMLTALLGVILATNITNATTCVIVRNGDGMVCMRFTLNETQNAEKYGLALTAPFTIVKQNLQKQGWKVDRKWLSESEAQPIGEEEMLCGSGYDAICTTAFRRDEAVLVLTLSGTNDGLPLIGVGPETRTDR